MRIPQMAVGIGDFMIMIMILRINVVFNLLGPSRTRGQFQICPGQI